MLIIKDLLYDYEILFRFELCVAYFNFIVFFQGLGNVTMDCTVIAFYAQAMVQFQTLKYNLEHLLEPSDLKHCAWNAKKISFVDANYTIRKKITRRFIRNVMHHQKIKWYLFLFYFYLLCNLFFGYSALVIQHYTALLYL